MRSLFRHKTSAVRDTLQMGVDVREDQGGLSLLSLHLDDGRWQADHELIVPAQGEALEFAWCPRRMPRGARSCAQGAVWVRGGEPAQGQSRPRPPVVTGSGDGTFLCRWPDPAHHGAVAAIVVLPPGYTLLKPEPSPLAATVKGECLVLLWSGEGRVLSWAMRLAGSSLASEAERLNAAWAGSPALEDIPGLATARKRAAAWKRRTAAAAIAGLALAGAMGTAALLNRARPAGRRTEIWRDPPVVDGSPAATWCEAKCYAVVVGINRYRNASPAREQLVCARNDAEAVADYLKRCGYEVTGLYDEQATREAIINAIEDDLVPKVMNGGRVVFYYAGHGRIQPVGDTSWGYLVPYDAADGTGTLISMERIEQTSERMADARHQLFVLDCCFSGLFGTRRGERLDPAEVPHYIRQVTQLKARQVLTSGGPNQTVSDQGRGRKHSPFTAALLDALKGEADSNADRFVTFHELYDYLSRNATLRDQAPGQTTLTGHDKGEFVFAVPDPAKPAAENGVGPKEE